MIQFAKRGQKAVKKLLQEKTREKFCQTIVTVDNTKTEIINVIKKDPKKIYKLRDRHVAVQVQPSHADKIIDTDKIYYSNELA